MCNNADTKVGATLFLHRNLGFDVAKDTITSNAATLTLDSIALVLAT